MLSRIPTQHRRVKSPCYLGSRHKHLSSIPARHHQRNDCSPRDNDGCRGRRPASTSEEIAFSISRPSCSHRNVSRTPCPAHHSRTSPSTSSARCVQTVPDLSVTLCPLFPSSASTLYCGRWLTGQSGSRLSRHMQPTF